MDAKELEAQVGKLVEDAHLRRTVEHCVWEEIDGYLKGVVNHFVDTLVDRLTDTKNPDNIVSNKVRELVDQRLQVAVQEISPWRLTSYLDKELEKAAPDMFARALAEMDATSVLRGALVSRVNEYLKAEVGDIVRAELGVISGQLSLALGLQAEIGSLRGELTTLRTEIGYLRR